MCILKQRHNGLSPSKTILKSLISPLTVFTLFSKSVYPSLEILTHLFYNLSRKQEPIMLTGVV